MNIPVSEEIEVEVWQVERPPETKPPKRTSCFSLKFTNHIKTRTTSFNPFVESHHHLSINTDTLIKSNLRHLIWDDICVFVFCSLVFTYLFGAGVCFKLRGRETEKKVTREKRLKTTRIFLISRIDTPAAGDRDLWEHVCLISEPERPTQAKERSKRCVITPLFYLLGPLISGQAKSVLTCDQPPNQSNCWTMKRSSDFPSLASHPCRKNAWTHSLVIV